VKLSLGSVNQLRQASGAVVEAVAAAPNACSKSVVRMDETSLSKATKMVTIHPAAPRLVVVMVTVGELLSRLAQPFSSYLKVCWARV